MEEDGQNGRNWLKILLPKMCGNVPQFFFFPFPKMESFWGGENEEEGKSRPMVVDGRAPND